MAFFIPFAANMAGFTQAGIAAVMSAAGSVAAGSFVAACQSIGATGAVSFTTAAAWAAYLKFLRREEPLTEDEAQLLVSGFRNNVMI